MNSKDVELKLFRETLDWLKTKEFKGKAEFVEHYERYFKVASTETHVLDEKWNAEGGFRHGADSIRGTTSEMLAGYCYIVKELKRIEQVPNKVKQKYGVDFKILERSSHVFVSVKSTKTWPLLNNDLSFGIYPEYFDPASWRIELIDLVNPNTKEIWRFHYRALAGMFCEHNEKTGIYTPKFKANEHLILSHYLKDFPQYFWYYDLKAE